MLQLNSFSEKLTHVTDNDSPKRLKFPSKDLKIILTERVNSTYATRKTTVTHFPLNSLAQVKGSA